MVKKFRSLVAEMVRWFKIIHISALPSVKQILARIALDIGVLRRFCRLPSRY
ncbi:MAG: hypothetical protein RL145_704 [Pseudomonadota bacterium]|jgi:hypothetical protein